MILLLLLLIVQGQEQGKRFTCSGTENERTCRDEDGDTYVERRLVDQIVRQGVSVDGSNWTEYLTRVFDGTRLVGSDSAGHRWSQQCNPRYGITGTDRFGATIFVPPRPRVPLTARARDGGNDADRFGALSNPVGAEQAPADACTGL